MVDIITDTAFDAPKRFNHRDDEVAAEFPSSVSSRSRGLLALRGMMWGSAKKSGPTARDYVQDGLIAMWHGIENAGFGVHDPSATVWKDLTGNYDQTLVGLSFDEDSIRVSGTNYSVIQYIPTASVIDIEIVFNRDSLQAAYIFSFSQAYNNKFIAMRGDGSVLYFGTGRYNFNTSPLNKHSYHFSYQNERVLYIDGAQMSSSTAGGSFSTVPGGINQYAHTFGTYGFAGNIHCIRVYSRALTPAEIAANYAVDKALFGLP